MTDDSPAWRERLRGASEHALKKARHVADQIEDSVEAITDVLRCGDDDDDERRHRHPHHPHRPGKTVGVSRGAIDGTPLTTGDLHQVNPPNSWAGNRKDLFMPLLFLRANPGDNGTRPVVGPFWESPDIYILAGVSPANAPDVPPQLGQTALAQAENTLYAHVWNFGRSAAREIIVEFYWIDPSLGISPQAIHLIGQTTTELGARGSGRAHAVVKCPEAWIATYLNGGHECLLVRAWSIGDDLLNTPEWDASLNRHIGQRNIHVISAAQAASAPPLQLRVGPLYGAGATVQVDRADPANMPWLQLHTGTRGQFPNPALPTGQPMLSPPTRVAGPPGAGPGASQHTVHGDDQQVAFTTTDSPPGQGQALVYRVSTQQDGQPVGGYTVVITG